MQPVIKNTKLGHAEESTKDDWSINDEEVKNCLLYISMKTQNFKGADIASALGIARPTLYTWIAKWNENGVMEKAQQIYTTPATEEYKNIQRQIYSRWGAILLSLEQTALRGTGMTKLGAIAMLKQYVIDPIDNAKVEEGSAESQYANRPADTSPTEIALPAHLLKRLSVQE